MIITKIELKNFLGLRKIENKEKTVILNFPEQEKNIILIKGENGYGKSTILENLTPYSQMLKRNLKDSIEYPAHKILHIKHLNLNYRLEIFWEDEKTTKGYIYINNILMPETSKGNITEYNYQIEKIFGEFDKFKNSVFLKQGTTEIIEANPTERLNIINKFMPSLEIYDKYKDFCDKELGILEGSMKQLEEQMNFIKTLKDKYERNKENEEKFNENIVNDYKTKLVEFENLKEEYSKYQEQLKNLNSLISQLENENSKLEIFEHLDKELLELQSKLVNFDEKEYYQLKENFNIFTKNIDILTNSNVLENNFDKIEEKEIILIEETIENLRNIEKEFTIKNIEKNNIENNIIKYKEEIEILEKNIKKYENITEKIKNLNSQKILLMKERKNLNLNELKEFLEKMKNFSAKTKKYNENFYFNTIEELQNLIKINEEKLLIEENNIKIFNEYNNFNEHINLKIKNLYENIYPIIFCENFIIELKNEIEILKSKNILLKEKNSLFHIIQKENNCPTCKQNISETYKLTLKNDSEEYFLTEKLIEEKNILLNELLQMEKLNYDNVKIFEQIENLKKELKIIPELVINEFELKNLKNSIEKMKNDLNELITIQESIQEITEYKTLLKNFNFYNFKELFEEYKNIFYIVKEDILKEEKIIQDINNIDNELKLLEKDESVKNEQILSLNNKKNEYQNLLNLLNSIKIPLFNKNELINLEKNLKDLNQLKFFYLTFEKFLNPEIKTYQNLLNSFFNIKEDIKLKINNFDTIKNNNAIVETMILKKQNQILNNNNNLILLNKNNDMITETKEKISNLKPVEFSMEDFLNFKKQYETFFTEYQNFLLDKQDLENKYKEFISLEEQYKNKEIEDFIWKRIKQYCLKIKKSIIAETFSEITDVANIILSNEGTIGNLRLSINQINNKKFEIKAKDIYNNIDVKDISYLSGAEALAVSKAISFALAKNTDFKILWLDESDGVLSKANKQVFVSILKKLFDLLNIDEIFVISHQTEVEEMVDYVVDLNNLKQQ